MTADPIREHLAAVYVPRLKLAAALRAVLETHASERERHFDFGLLVCVECSGPDEPVRWPCPTYRAIATQLEIEL